MVRSSTKQGSKLGGGIEVDKFEKLRRKEELHLSGASIRSLVKQVTSSRTKEPILNTTTGTDPEGFVDGDGFHGQNPTKQQPPVSAAPQPHKKQVRRRLHTSRPYQERLLNMAEARREIVSALKFHRASMKQQQQQQQQQPPPPPQPLQEDEQEMHKSMRPIYPSNYLGNIVPNPFSWSTSSIAPPSAAHNFNLALPNEPLGLNLNFHDFNNSDATLYHNSNANNYPSFSPSSSSSPVLSTATTEELIPDLIGGGGMHPAMDDEEMAATRSIGEQHGIEWSDKMNLVTSTWWFKYLKSMEIDREMMSAEDDGYNSPFDQVMDFPLWLINVNEGCCLQEHFYDLCSNDYLQDHALPCVDIEEIEGKDGEWLD